MDDVLPADDRERRLIEAVVSLAKTFREERDHLVRRLGELEREIEMLAIKLDEQQRRPPVAPPDARPHDPSRTPS